LHEDINIKFMNPTNQDKSTIYRTCRRGILTYRDRTKGLDGVVILQNMEAQF